ncbi:MAG: glycosyltransferase family 2 protein [Candidatus Omnitrophota bacterium]
MGSRTDNTVVIIPSYNEARTIGDIVKSVAKRGMSVFVIDDGSSDNTGRVALDSGAKVIRNEKNRGKGAAVRVGVTYVLEKTGFEWIVIMDGDGQHHTEDIPVLMDATRDGEADLVIGNRMMDTEKMPVVRYWTNRFTSWIISRLCGQYIPDTQCGYRIVKVSALRKMELLSEKYDIETEMLIEAAENNMKIRSAPVQTIYGDEVSEIHPVYDTLRFCALIVKCHFALMKAKRRDRIERG